MTSCAVNSKTKRCRKSGHGDSRCYFGPKNRCRLVKTKRRKSASSKRKGTTTKRRVYKPTAEERGRIISSAVKNHSATLEDERKIRKYVTNFKTTKRKHLGAFGRHDLQERNALVFYLHDQIDGWYKIGRVGDI